MKIGLILICLICISLVSAAEFKADLLTPSATFRVNESDIIEHYIEVHNPNNFSVDVSIIKPEDVDIILEKTELVLGSGETRRIDYKIRAEENVSTMIGVVFSSDQGNLGLQSAINIIVNEKSSQNYFYYAIIVIVAIIILTYIMLKKMKGGAKNETRNNNFIDDVDDDGFGYSSPGGLN